MDVKPEAVAEYNEHVHKWLERTQVDIYQHEWIKLTLDKGLGSWLQILV